MSQSYTGAGRARIPSGVKGKREVWWICEPGKVKKLGPFESVDLAVKVRSYVEAVERRDDLSVQPEWVDA